MNGWRRVAGGSWILAAALMFLPTGGQEPPKSDSDHSVGQPAEPPNGDQPKTDGDEPIAAPPPPAAAETPKEPESLAPATPAPERRRAIIRALDPGSRIKTGPDRSVVARGKLQMVIPDDEVILYCNAVDYSGETTGIATVTGDLKILTGKLVEKDGIHTIPEPENTVTGDIGYVFTKEKRAVIDGNVVILHQPQEEAPKDADDLEKARYDPTTVYCDRLTYWYRKGDRKAVAQPRLPNTRIRFEQPTRRGTAGKATFYDFEAGQSETGDVLDLVGGVKAEDDEGQRLQAEVLRIYVDREVLDGYNFEELVINLEREERSPEEPTGVPERPGGEQPPGGQPPAGEQPPAEQPPAGEQPPAEQPPAGEQPPEGNG